MARVNRVRERNLSFAGPGVNNWHRTNGSSPGGETYPPKVVGYEYCADSHGTPFTDSQFDLYRTRGAAMNASGTYTSGGWVYNFSGVPMNETPQFIVRKPWAHTYFSRPPLSDNILGQMALANANPNTPDIDLPVSIAELRELPSLVRDVGRSNLAHLPKAFAKANLISLFGIVPVLQDIVTLAAFTDKVAEREKYLRSLNHGFKRIKRRLTREDWTGQTNGWTPWPQWVDQGLTTTNKVNLLGTMTRSYWYTVRLKLSATIAEKDLRSSAVRSVLGLDGIHAKQAWELLPWSWLIDYFSSVGSTLAAFRQGIPFNYEGLCVMHETKYATKAVFPNKAGYISCPTSPSWLSVVKHRHPVPIVWALPEYRIPYLSENQWSILASLAVLRL